MSLLVASRPDQPIGTVGPAAPREGCRFVVYSSFASYCFSQLSRSASRSSSVEPPEEPGGGELPNTLSQYASSSRACSSVGFEPAATRRSCDLREGRPVRGTVSGLAGAAGGATRDASAASSLSGSTTAGTS